MKVWLEAWLSEYGKAWCSMKIEKVNDNQIRCTLTREDLAERQIKLSELAYGTEKAKLLFRDMMQQAAYEFGFEADDIPLMIRGNTVVTGHDYSGDYQGGVSGGA